MVMSIDANLVTQFSDRLHVEAQQMQARLRPYVMIKPMTGDVYAYDGLGVVEAQELSGRIEPTQFADITHTRRKIARRRFSLTLPIDDMDTSAVLISPQSEYAAACIRAMERVFDRVVTEAMFAAVLTGRDFDTSVTFANDGGSGVGKTVDGTSGFTYEVLLELRRNFIDADVGNDMPEKFVMGITGDEHTDLMSESELTSGDFSRQFVVDRGEITVAAGINLVKFAGAASNPILPVASSVRSCFCMSSRAMCVGLSKNMTVKITERNDYVDVSQVQITFILGAVRTEGKLIQKVTATE